MKKVALLDICLSDYFTGYHLPVCAVAVFGKMTNKDIAESIKSEMNAVWEYLFDDNPAHEKLYNDYINELLAKPNDVFVELDKEDEEYECCYAHFSVINPVYANGIMFLNP
jgi:hypothetical protein